MGLNKAFVSLLLVLLEGVLVIVPSGISAEMDGVIAVGRFSKMAISGAAPTGWSELKFRKIKSHTSYSLVQEDGVVAVKARSDKSASALTVEVDIDVKEYPILKWRWKVTNILAKGDVTRKDGDDYPARVYVTFGYEANELGLLERAKRKAIKLFYGAYPPYAAINYIWNSQSSFSEIVPNAYTDRVKMITVEAGPEMLNQWVEEERNVYEDYLAAFGAEPPAISGIAIMTDTDDTRESATAYFGDIEFRSASLSGH